MNWNVEISEEFRAWFGGLTEGAQDTIDRVVGLLEIEGPELPLPHSKAVDGMGDAHVRELHVQIDGERYKIFYAFDPGCSLIFLIGPSKSIELELSS